MIRHLPNLLTCANLICGCLGILNLFKGGYDAAYFVWAACVFDFFDGFAARLLKVSSPIGKELDSLADMVSFGVLPALTLYQWINELTNESGLAYVALLIAAFSALRLAIFNLDTRQSDSFIGLPTPANAIFITALIFSPASLLPIVFNPWCLSAIAIVFSYLLVSPLRLFALKFKSFGWAGNSTRYVFLAFSLALVIIFKAGALPWIILSYIVISLIQNGLGRKE